MPSSHASFLYSIGVALARSLKPPSPSVIKIVLPRTRTLHHHHRRSMSQAYSTEEQVAVAAVRRACRLTASVFTKLVQNETLTKDDKSPVTVGDFAAQAVISTILQHAFPADPIVGEEDASDLRADSAAAREMKGRIVALANEALTAELGFGDNENWGIGPGRERTDAQLLDAIDRGNFEGGGTGRMWTIDPIDGTKGFLRGEQYAVCLALIVDAQVQVGVIGCPNLPVDCNPDAYAAEKEKGTGCIFTAVRGQGAKQLTLSGSNPTPLSISPLTSSPTSTSTPTKLAFLESVEPAHSSHTFNARVAQLLSTPSASSSTTSTSTPSTTTSTSITTAPPIRMDSQAKYGCLARGEGGAYLRMPTGVGYREKIWDHAPGQLLVEESGGLVTDSRGEPLNFGLGRTLGENFGVIAAGRDVHPLVLAAVQKALAESEAEAETKAKV